MSTNVHLTAELERFARECVESGRYNNVSEVMRAALRMLQEREERLRQFNASLDDAVAEADRDGWVSLDDVMTELDAIIDGAEKTKA